MCPSLLYRSDCHSSLKISNDSYSSCSNSEDGRLTPVEDVSSGEGTISPPSNPSRNKFHGHDRYVYNIFTDHSLQDYVPIPFGRHLNIK